MGASNQFLRKAELLIGDEGSALDLSQFHFTFSVKQADAQNPQWVMVRIYNVSDETFNLLKEYTQIVIRAGYQTGSFGVVFNGQVIQAKAGRESPVDTYVDILAAEGYEAHQKPVNATLTSGSTMLDLAKVAAAAMGRTLNSYLTTTPPNLTRGQAIFGMARDALSSAAAKMGATWYYTSTGIDLVPLDKPKPGSATVISSATGMIGWPEQTQDGIRVRCLLNADLQVGSPLQINNASIQLASQSASFSYIPNQLPSLSADGLYRIYVIEHSGNTRGQEWYSDIVALSVDLADSNLTGLNQKMQL